MDHINLLRHTIIYQDKFSDIDRFLQLARDHDKIIVNDDLTMTLRTPPTVPPTVDQIKNNEATGGGNNPTTVAEYMNLQNPTVAGGHSKKDAATEDMDKFKELLGVPANNYTEHSNQ